MTWQSDYSRDYEVKNHMECQNRSDKYIWSPHDAYFYKGLSELIVDIDRLIYLSLEKIRKDFVFINVCIVTPLWNDAVTVYVPTLLLVRMNRPGNPGD